MSIILQVIEDRVITMVAEEEVDMNKIVEETNLAAAPISADAIEEIQTGDPLPKMISERLPQVHTVSSRSKILTSPFLKFPPFLYRFRFLICSLYV